MDEVRRIRGVVSERDRSGVLAQRYSFFTPSQLHAIQERERKLLRMLERHGFGARRLEQCAVLSIGCGSASELLELVRYGASPGRLVGVDLARDRLRRASARHPAFLLTEANAAELPFRDASFDLVMQFTLFTSVLDSESRRRIGAEVLRVLRPGAMVVWYDFWPNNPWNTNVRGIRPAEIRGLFPGCTYDLQGLTLLPPLARWLVPRSWLLADLLSRIPLLTSSYLAAIEKPHE